MLNHPLAAATPEQLRQLEFAYSDIREAPRETPPATLAPAPDTRPPASRVPLVDRFLQLANEARHDACQLRGDLHRVVSENMGLRQKAAQVEHDNARLRHQVAGLLESLAMARAAADDCLCHEILRLART